MLKARSKLQNGVSIADARADQGSDPSENQEKHKEETRLANHHAQYISVLQKFVKKWCRKGTLRDTFWVNFDDQDEPAHRRRHAQDIGKHRF